MKTQTKMKKILFFYLACLISLTATAQQDPEALKILTSFSKKATAAPSVSISFSAVTNNIQEGSITSVDGSVVISGDRYKLLLPDNNIWADSKTIWSYLPDVNEVTITEPDINDKSFFSKPSLLFSLYKEGYKIRLLEQTSKDWIIDLYPEDITTNLVRIRLKIGKALYDLKSAEYKTKEGLIVMLNCNKYDLTFKPAGEFFSFSQAAYKDVEVIDMR